MMTKSCAGWEKITFWKGNFLKKVQSKAALAEKLIGKTKIKNRKQKVENIKMELENKVE